jgi:hypothetical protein
MFEIRDIINLAIQIEHSAEKVYCKSHRVRNQWLNVTRSGPLLYGKRPAGMKLWMGKTRGR